MKHASRIKHKATDTHHRASSIKLRSYEAVVFSSEIRSSEAIKVHAFGQRARRTLGNPALPDNPRPLVILPVPPREVRTREGRTRAFAGVWPNGHAFLAVGGTSYHLTNPVVPGRTVVRCRLAIF